MTRRSSFLIEANLKSAKTAVVYSSTQVIEMHETVDFKVRRVIGFRGQIFYAPVDEFMMNRTSTGIPSYFHWQLLTNILFIILTHCISKWNFHSFFTVRIIFIQE